MSNLLRLAMELDRLAESWLETAKNACAPGVQDFSRECKARSVGLYQAAEMARHMHNECPPDARGLLRRRLRGLTGGRRYA